MFEVQNQPPPLEPYNLFASDAVLREAVKREQAAWADGELTALGATLGKPETVQLGFDANRYAPVLRTLDRYGHRIDEVDFHPAWHALLGIALNAGLHSSPWAKPQAGAHVARAAGCYMLGQIEAGVYCPIAMTYGSVPTLRQAPAIASEWLPRIFARDYDRALPPGQREDRGADRHGPDREPGRLRPAHQHHARRARRRRQLPPARAQMVPVGADVRRLPGAGAIAERPELLPAAALDAGRRTQCHSYPSPQGQARQPLQCFERGGVRRCLCATGRRGRPRHSDHDRNGRLHAARLLPSALPR